MIYVDYNGIYTKRCQALHMYVYNRKSFCIHCTRNSYMPLLSFLYFASVKCPHKRQTLYVKKKMI